MSEQWFKDYVLLQFRMDKAIRKFTESRFVILLPSDLFLA